MGLPDGRGAVKVHEGFYETFAACRNGLQACLDTRAADLGLYITGHSLGGALAQIASGALECDTLAACYTFGSPRVGDAWFDVIVKCPHYRVVDRYDVVPTVPPPFWGGYVHTGDPRLIRLNLPFALRRERSMPARVAANVVGLVSLVVTHEALIINDHAISRCGTISQGIADARNAPLPQRRVGVKPIPVEVAAAAALLCGLGVALLLTTK